MIILTPTDGTNAQQEYTFLLLVKKRWNIREGNTMNVSEWQDRHEYKYHLTGEEEHQAENDKKIAKYFEGTLKPINRRIIKKLKEEVRI